ncbi:MAG: hypothetical protein J7518_13740 [Nocardioidaceae bacterium]|nr:hypothetical protein [Nocardioidaceae bacterium]
MALSWIARALAALALVAWLLEDFAIAAAGGPGESGLEDSLFRIGLVAYLGGAVAFSQVYARTRPGDQRLMVAVAAVAVAVVAALLLGPVMADALPGGWFADRVGYLVAALALLLVTMSSYALRRRARASAPEVTPPPVAAEDDAEPGDAAT